MAHLRLSCTTGLALVLDACHTKKLTSECSATACSQGRSCIEHPQVEVAPNLEPCQIYIVIQA